MQLLFIARSVLTKGSFLNCLFLSLTKAEINEVVFDETAERCMLAVEVRSKQRRIH